MFPPSKRAAQEGSSGSSRKHTHAKLLSAVLNDYSPSDVIQADINCERSLLCTLAREKPGVPQIRVFSIAEQAPEAANSSEKASLIGSTTTKLTLVDVLFHAFEPIIFAIAAGPAALNKTAYSIVEFSLLFPSLPLLATTDLPGQYIADSLLCTSTGALSYSMSIKSEVSTAMHRSSWCFTAHPSFTPRLSLDTYLDGDVGESHSSAHSMLMLNPHLVAGTKSPLMLSHHVFSSKLARNGKDRSAVAYVGSLLSPDDALPASLLPRDRPKVFVPLSLLPLTETSSFADDNWCAIVNGIAVEDASGVAVASACMCLLRRSAGALVCSFTRCACGAPLNDPAQAKQGLLVVDASGKVLRWLSTSAESFGASLGEWTMSVAVQRVFTCPHATSKGVVLLVQSEMSGQILQKLYSVDASRSFAMDDQSQGLTLSVGETVSAVEWLVRSKRPQYSGSDLGLVAVLTSNRVLITSSSLSAKSSYVFTKRETVVSIQWVGFALVFMNDSGLCSYILPGPVNTGAAFSTRLMLLQKYGIDCAEGESHSLCSIAADVAANTISRLVNCLPDRLTFSVYSVINTNESCRVKLLSKPLYPLEPLMLGLLWFAITRTDTDVSTDMTACLTSYMGTKAAHSAAEYGAVASSHASCKLALMLFCAGFFEYAAIVSGIDISASMTSSLLADGEFPRYRWIPALLKYEILKALGCYGKACVELLSMYPEALEIFIDPENTSAMLPRRKSHAASTCSAAARDLFKLNQHSYALLLADIAGDDYLLARMLKELNRASELVSLSEQVKVLDSVLYLSILAMTSADSSSIELDDAFITFSDVGHPTRRSSLLVSTRGVEDSFKPTVSLTEADKRKHEQARGGGVGPLTRLGVLVADSVDEWMGTPRSEVVLSGGKAAAVATALTASEAQAIAESALPASWIDDVGRGKEWDLCSGYWRFSDLVHPGEEEFTSTCQPNARVNFSDLSKYSIPLELYASADDQVQLEPSTSAVDPGEDHEKVKSLYDLVIGAAAATGLSGLGLRCMVARGGPLDVGMCHSDPDRCRFTLEVCLYKIEGSKTAASSVVATRRLLSATGDSSDPIWTLSVDSQGSLNFKFDKNPSEMIMSGEKTVNMGPTDDVEVSVWNHVALVIDAGEFDDLAAAPSSAHVFMYVNGALLVDKIISIPSYQEDELEKTLLLVCPDMIGWRMTELRLWSCARSASDIENHRDNYLSLASKRKRLQFRIKGGKKLFGPIGSLSIGMPGSTSGSKLGANSVEETSKEVQGAPKIRSSLKTVAKALPLISAANALKSPLKSPRGNVRPKLGFNSPTEKSPSTLTVSLPATVIGLLPTFGLTHQHFCAVDSVTRPHALPGFIVLCKDGEIVLVLLTNDSSSVLKYKLPCDSVVMSPRKDVKILALFSQKKLSVFNIDSRKKLAEQPIATQLQFWKFSSVEVILLVTPLVVYSWEFGAVVGGALARPTKLCTRVDSKELDRVIDVLQCHKWLVLSTANLDNVHRLSLINCAIGKGKCYDALTATFFAPMLHSSVVAAIGLCIIFPSSTNPLRFDLLYFMLSDDGDGGLDLEKPVWKLALPAHTLRLDVSEQWMFLSRSTKDGVILVNCNGGSIYAVDVTRGLITPCGEICPGETLLSIQSDESDSFTSGVVMESGSIVGLNISEL